ncbi:MAG TPA: hypothetical protein VGP97_23310 [Burkholderiales bacterium]|jgi:hypothetical protein|nr:hypothetical protein [Burkholderiales bacterium]
MRTAAFAACFLALACVFASEPALARHTHTHVGVAVGFGYPYRGPWGPWYYPPPYYYYPPAIVVQPQQPTTYIEQSTPAKQTAPSSERWWYYCDASEGYYPYVKECPSGWERVPPAPTK